MHKAEVASSTFDWKFSLWFAIVGLAQIGIIFIFAKNTLELRHGAFWFIAPFVVTSALAAGIWRHQLESYTTSGIAPLALKVLFNSFIASGLTYFFLDVTCSTCVISIFGSALTFLFYMFASLKLGIMTAPVSIAAAFILSKTSAE